MTTTTSKSCTDEMQSFAKVTQRAESWGEVHPHVRSESCSQMKRIHNVAQQHMWCSLTDPAIWSLPDSPPSSDPLSLGMERQEGHDFSFYFQNSCWYDSSLNLHVYGQLAYVTCLQI